MYPKFHSYIEYKEEQKLAQMVDSFCEALALAEVDFEEYWEQEGLPALLKEEYESEEQLLNELITENIWNRVKGAFGFGQQQPKPTDMIGRLGQWQQQQTQSKKTSEIDNYKAEVQNAVKLIKNQFSKAVAAFVKNVETSGNTAAMRLAQSLQKGIINQFGMGADNMGQRFVARQQQQIMDDPTHHQQTISGQV